VSHSQTSFFAGIDLGGTNVATAIGDANGNIVAHERQLTGAPDGHAAVIGRIASSVERLASRAGIRLDAVGMGVPGLVDIAAGETRFLPNLSGNWKDVPLASCLSERLGCPVHLLNDARAAALGEAIFGLGRGVRTMLIYTLGTGVGGGIVIDGRLHMGPLGTAGEIGHVCVQADGPWCSCGSRGCLETFVSGPALAGEGVRLMLSGNAPALKRLCGGDMNRVSPEILGEAAREGDVGVQAAIERAGSLLGLAASGQVLALHPDLIILSGGVAGLTGMLTPPMRRAIQERVRMFPVDRIRVERSSLGEMAGVLGAIAVARQGGAMPAERVHP
jgi:glucokinase